MEVNDYAEPDRRSPACDWLIRLGIPFVVLVILLAVRFVPELIKARMA